MNLKEAIRNFPNFPNEGIIFRDITSILKNPAYLNEALTQMENLLENVEYDVIVSPESRGFIFGVPIAARQNKAFVPARKKGKLPGETLSKSYSLEYGEDVIQIHKDDILAGQKVVIIDDLLATGGTVSAVCDIVEQMGASVAAAVFLIELIELNGADVLKKYTTKSIIRY